MEVLDIRRTFNRPREKRIDKEFINAKPKGYKRSSDKKPKTNRRGSRTTYQRYRRRVLERDHYKCVVCRKFQEKGLRVHHIYSWEDYKELRFALENGVTLCTECHDEDYIGSFHDIYGVRGNTLEQFIEFYENKTGIIFDYSLLVD